jgi:hypothetical protein
MATTMTTPHQLSQRIARLEAQAASRAARSSRATAGFPQRGVADLRDFLKHLMDMQPSPRPEWYPAEMVEAFRQMGLLEEATEGEGANQDAR